MTETANASPQVKLKGIALPVQHGGWGFLLEPIVLGFIVAPSVPAIWLSLAAFGAFLLHQPLKVAVKDYRKGKRYARTTYAWIFAGLYGAIALSMVLVAYFTSPYAFLIPIVLAVPLGVFQFSQELSNQNREVLAEMLGALAVGAVAAAISQMDGWRLGDALVLWFLLAVRVVPSILYVRARLRLERGNETSPITAWGSHLAGLGLILFSALGPWLAVVGATMLLARAVYGLSRYRRPSPAKVIGFQEIGFGLIYVVLIGIGYRVGF